MYCYNCGKEIYKGMQHCPYCNTIFNENILDDVIFCNSLKQISDQSTRIGDNHIKEFNIDQLKVVVKGNDYIFSYVLNFLNGLRCYLKQSLKNYISGNHFDTIVKKGEGYIESLLTDAVYLSLAFIYRNDPQKITSKTKNAFFELTQMAEEIWEPVYTAAGEFKSLHQELGQIRQSYNKTRSSYWVGGGFGIRGAIKGKIKADILNTGSSVLNTAGNVVRNAIQAGIDHSREEDLKNQVRHSPQLRHAVMIGINNFSENVARLLTQTMCGNDMLERYMGIYDIISTPNYELENMSFNQAQIVLSENPFNITAYVTIYHHDRNNGNVLSEMANFCGLQEHVFSGFIDCDGTFGGYKFDVDSIGVDIGKVELLQIKDLLINIEKNNPAYTSITYKDTASCAFIRESWIKDEQKYHQKVDTYLLLHRINESRTEIEKLFSNNDVSYAIRVLSEREDIVIENLLLKKLLVLLEEAGTEAFINKIGDDHLYPIVTDAILIHNHKLIPMENAGLAGRFHVLAHIGKYLYTEGNLLERQRGMEYLIEAGKKQVGLGLSYLSNFYKKGEGGLKRDEFTSDLCGKIAAAYKA